MTFANKLALLSMSIACFAFSATALAGAPAYVNIRGITHAGSGCPAGTVAENLSSDGKALTLLFDTFIAESGPGVSYRESRKNCQVLIDLDYPQGWSFAIFKADYRGFMSLERRTFATQKATYYFQGNSHQCSFATKVAGPFDDDYAMTDTVALSALVWSPCGAKRALNINTQVRTDNRRNRRAFALATVDSFDATVEQMYNFKWRRCR